VVARDVDNYKCPCTREVVPGVGANIGEREEMEAGEVEKW
jgi:hypothetical protein